MTGCYLEEGGALQDAGGAAHLSDGVHGELRPPDVHHGDAKSGGQDGADGGAARAVITHHHVLQDTHTRTSQFHYYANRRFQSAPVLMSCPGFGVFISHLNFCLLFLCCGSYGALPGDLLQLLRNKHTHTHTCRGTPTLLPISLTTEAVTAVVA